jgi:hypothetical protein
MSASIESPRFSCGLQLCLLIGVMRDEYRADKTDVFLRRERTRPRPHRPANPAPPFPNAMLSFDQNLRLLRDILT